MIKFLNMNFGADWSLSKNYKWEFKTFDFAVFFKDKKLIFFTVRYFLKPTSKKTRDALKKLNKHISKVREEVEFVEEKERKEIELGILQISWFKER